MKTFLKFSLFLAFAVLACNMRAAPNDVANFSGMVVDAKGNPLADASVACYQYPTRMGIGPLDMTLTQHTTTDGQGVFAFPTFHGQAVVLVTKAGAAPCWRTWYAAAPEEPQKITLGASSALAGEVVDDTGQPVADAEVFVSFALNKTTTDIGQPNYLFGKIARELFSTRTSADGKFRIENFPADAQAVLAVKKTGQALRQTANLLQMNELPFHAGQEDITLALDPAGNVSGKVMVRGTGQLLAHAVISLQPVATGIGNLLFDMGKVVSAADGTFEIRDVPAGSYQVMANFTNAPVPDWVADPVSIKVVAGQTVSGVQLPTYKGGILEVTVRGNNNHELVADASVSVNSEDFNRAVTTGTNGVANFRLPAGQFTVFVSKPNWSQAQTQTPVTDGQTTQVTIELPAPSKVTGIVRDASGAPVADATVGVFPDYGNNGAGTKTDANGHYEVTWQKPSWAGQQNQSFYLMARQSERKLAAMKEMDETTKSLDLTLQPAMSISGRVQDATGKPVANVTAYISIHEENSSFTISRQPVRSDEQGRIQADGLPMGERYGWYVSAPGYGSSHQEMDAADPKADHYDFPPLTLKLANRKLAGRVLGANGTPVAGVQVFMQGDGQPTGNAVTDANGRFAFDAVCEGPVTVSANSKGAYGSAEVMGGDTNVVIRFDTANRVYMPASALTLTGTVYDSSGSPADGARVVVTPTFGMADTAKTDDKGEYSVHWQPQMGMRGAKYFAVARDLDRNLAAIEPVDTNKTSVTLRLEPALSISGTVLDANGNALTRANINLNIMVGNMGGMVDYQPTKMNSDGTFTIPGLPMGQQYNLYVTASGYGSAQKSVGKTQSQTNSIQLSPFKLKLADRQLAGQVLGADGKPLPGVQVMINGNGQPNANIRADANGHFTFKVCAGPIRVFAFSPSSPGRNNSGSSQARGGDMNVVVKMGVQQQPSQIVVREIPLKPQPWTLSALETWPASHKTGTVILLSLQAAVLLGTAGGVFWFTRKLK